MTSVKSLMSTLKADLKSHQSVFQISSIAVDKTYTNGAQARVAVSTSNQAILLIPASVKDLASELPQSGAIQTTVVSYKDSQGATVRFIQITCQVKELEDVFLDLIDNICTRLRSGGQPIKCIFGAMEEFRDLLRLPGKIERTKVIGLVGELFALARLLRVYGDSANFWTGPGGGRRDFTLPGCTIEIKTSERTQDRRVTVHSLDQLETSPKETLYLWYFELEENNGNGSSVSDMVSHLDTLVQSKSDFHERLNLLGYNQSTASTFDKPKWSLLFDCLFHVNDNFPRITSKSFTPGELVGISHLTYQVDLNQADTCVVQFNDVMV